MDRYRCLQTFVKVAEVQSITKAARALNISKSVVSERVSQLENLVGKKLLVRTTRKIRLTEIGHETYPIYSDIVTRMGDIENSVQNRDNGLSGRLRISSTIDTGISEISTITSKFAKLNPDLNMELIIGNSFINPLEDAFDVALHFKRHKSPHIKQEKIAEFKCGVFASRDYISANGFLDTPDDLLSHRCMGYSHQASFADWNTSNWEFEKGGTPLSVMVSLAARFNSSHTLLSFIADGHGIGILPYLRLKDTLTQHSNLIELLEDYTVPSIALYATSPKEATYTIKLQKYIDFLKTEFAKLDNNNLRSMQSY